MKRFSLALMACLITATAGISYGQEQYKIDPVHSSVLFRVKHLNTAYVYGRFNEFTGTFAVDPAQPQNSKLELTVQTESVDTANADRDKHLRSPDFFNTAQFPTATFKSTAFRTINPKQVEVTGELTLNGVTKSINAQLELTGEGASPFQDYRKGLYALLKVNRSEFGIKFMPGGLSEEVLLIVSLEGIRQ